MWKKIVTIVFSIFILCIVVYSAILWIGLRADVAKIKNYHPDLTTQIFDRKNRLIANIFGTQFRFYVNFDEIPPRMVEALLAVEDTLFFEHGGINYDAILRAMIKNIISGKYLEGGSTLTQQLVKNMVLTRDKTLSRKLKEAFLAIQVEHTLTKEQILERYFNETFFGHGYYGVKTAALGYFKTPLNRLSLKEIAMLVALPRAPSFYDPTKNLDFSLSRANSIINRMYSLGWISKEEFQEATAEIPQVYNQTLTQNAAPYVTDEVIRRLSDIKDLKTGGYQIRTSIDLDYQNIAQKALLNGYDNIKKRLEKENNHEENDINGYDSLNGAMVVTDTKTGKILALVGGVDYDKSVFNRATKANRQFGSSVKPFIYQIAFDDGYSMAMSIPDAARIYDSDEVDGEKKYWKPSNFSKSFKGLVTLKEALSHSLNVATINLVQIVGFDKVYAELQDYGFKNMPKDMSIILGSFSISPIDAAKEYSIFSNHGTMVTPTLIESITDRSGNVNLIEDNDEKIITTPQQAFLTLSILEEVVSDGTGRRAKVKGIDIAGKTGTTNKNIDAWFSGFTPSIQAIIWYGRDDNTPIGSNESGGVISAPVFSYFISNVLKIDPGLKRKFDIPEGVNKTTIGKNKYYYTKQSPLPEKKPQNNIDEKLLF